MAVGGRMLPHRPAEAGRHWSDTNGDRKRSDKTIFMQLTRRTRSASRQSACVWIATIAPWPLALAWSSPIL
jgi:hypothetical protein